MRAVVAEAPGGPEVLRMRDLPVPAPGPGQVRLRVAYSGLNPLDVFARAGRVSWMPVPWPFVPGLEHTGRVEAIGPGADPSLLGRRMISRQQWGGCAELSLAAASALVPVPEGFDWKTATVFRGCGHTAWHVLHAPPALRAGQVAVFHSAAGPVGLMLTQIAKSRHAIVIGLAGGPRKIAFARPFGADHLIDYLAADWPAETRRLTGGRGADLIVDGNGGPQAARNYEAVDVGGRIIYTGATAGSPAPDVSVALLVGKSIAVAGFNLPLLEGAEAKEIPELLEAIRSGRFRVPLGEEAALQDVPALHARFERRELVGRTVIRVGGEI
jgi:NADPH2:quinone reductase